MKEVCEKFTINKFSEGNGGYSFTSLLICRIQVAVRTEHESEAMS